MPEAYLNVTNPEYASGTPEYLFSGLGEADSASLHCMKISPWETLFLINCWSSELPRLCCHSCAISTVFFFFFFHIHKKSLVYRTKTLLDEEGSVSFQNNEEKKLQEIGGESSMLQTEYLW